MKKLLLLVSAVSFLTSFTFAQSPPYVKLAWDSNTEADLAGYKLYIGTSTRQYSATFDLKLADLPDQSNPQWEVSYPDFKNGGTFYFAVTAYDLAGNESGYSNEVSYTFTDTTPPAVPLNLTLVEGSS